MTKKLWFRAKTYGWGWTPCSWEGWLALAGYVAGIFIYVRSVVDTALNGMFGTPLWYHLLFVMLNVLFIGLCFAKGEKPGWRWGKPAKS